MSITRSYEGVRHVVVDDLGDGSITVIPGARPDVVEASIEGADDAYLEQIQIRHDRDWLRISFPQQFLRYTKAELRLDVPDGLDYTIKTGSAHLDQCRNRSRQDRQRLRRHHARQRDGS